MNTLKKILCLVLLAQTGLVLDSQKAHAIDPIPYLAQEMSAMKSLEPFLETEDLNRLGLYEQYTQIVINKLRQYGVGHVQTFEAFQDQIVGMDAGSLYFQSLGTESWGKDSVKIINDVQDLMIATYGFDRRAYDHTLMRLLAQIDMQCTNLKHYGAPERILAKLRASSITRAMTIVQSSLGSRPDAFAAAHAIAADIKSLYPDLVALNGASSDLYNTALTLRFFNERLIDYAQYHDL